MNIAGINAFNANKAWHNFKTNNAAPVFTGNRAADKDVFLQNDENKIQNLIIGNKARDYQLKSEFLDNNFPRYIDFINIDNAVITLGENKAFCLGDQPLIRRLCSADPASLIISNNFSDADIKLPPGPEILLRLSNSGRRINITSFASDKQPVGLAYKVELNPDESLYETEVDFLPIEKTKQCFSNIDIMPKDKEICLGQADRLFFSPKVVILPSEDGCSSSFLVSAQKRIRNLNEGESLVIGRKTKDDTQNGRHDKLFTDLRNSRLISREHLLVENRGGEIYMTNIGSNRTYIADF